MKMGPEPAAEWACRTRAEQGLSTTVSDPDALRLMAALFELPDRVESRGVEAITARSSRADLQAA